MPDKEKTTPIDSYTNSGIVKDAQNGHHKTKFKTLYNITLGNITFWAKQAAAKWDLSSL